ncbi:MAG TPA: DNA-directed RNA polymerase subunit omega [Armatimonadota bacterium]|jgi:DNA-directed RNA polymerase subunit omega
MVIPSGDEVESKVISRYSMVIAVAKRTKELREGAPKLVESKSKNLITIAMEEIAAGKVKVVVPTQAEIEAASRRQELVPQGRPKAKIAADLLKVPESFELEETLVDAEEESAALAETGENEESELLAEEDTDEDPRPLDEIVGSSDDEDEDDEDSIETEE